jgi:4-aminobutyrate aminotransferase / (S)-3-amino-2-methylpropionate transaminase / 5-aminovalerate transaminase
MAQAIQLKTAIPGPRSQALLARREAALPRGIGATTPLFVARAEGARLEDVDGNVFLDFAGGIGTLNVGHTNPAVITAAKAQLDLFTHTCFSVAMYEPYVALCEKLVAITPGSFPKKAMLLNSGAEAVENAVKIARRATGRSAVVVFEHGFHGRTLLGMTMTSKIAPYKQGFGPFAPEIYRLPFPYEYRSEAPQDAAACRALCEEFFTGYVAADQVACVVIEPVVGEGGFIVAPGPWLRELAAICREKGILLVADEVQTGFARTGKMFACEHHGLEPDLVVLAKSMGGGLPVSAVVGRAEVMDAPQPGGLGGTYIGNPVACAAALAAIDFVESENLVDRAAAIGRKVEARFAEFVQKYPWVGEARGLGAMRALELVTDPVSKAPDKARVGRIAQHALAHGLILISAGNHGNVIRTLMPLVITDDELAEGLDVLEAAIAGA